MLETARAVVHEGRIELLDPLPFSEGTEVVVSAIPHGEEGQFWTRVSETTLDALWNNSEDDIYAELLQR